MPNPKLVDYIEKHLKKGIHADKIKSKLLEVGHDIEHVEDALIHVHHKNNVTKIAITAAMIVLMVALIVIEARSPEETKVAKQEVEMFSPPVEKTVTPEQTSEEKMDNLLTTIKSDPKYKGYEIPILMAFEKMDSSYCDKITDKDVKKDCRRFVGENKNG